MQLKQKNYITTKCELVRIHVLAPQDCLHQKEEKTEYYYVSNIIASKADKWRGKGFTYGI
jgi:hypothetical protein